MDFLKTLLLYMTVTIATAVQDGPLPADVPTPAITPTAVVEQESPSPAQSAMPGLQVDLPSVTTQQEPTAEPSPTITPNKSYSNIEFGDRGKNVKKMQERLIELGYLPEGAADGAFGYQTNRALREFQSKNGLNKDGVAGPATLTRLYEDPDVIALATPTPEPTDTPAPETETTQTIAPPEGETPAGLTMTEVPAPEPEKAPAEAGEGNTVAGLTQIADARIALLNSGAPLAALRLVDGVMKPFYPRVWQNAEGAVMVSLRDMAESINAWTLQIEDNVYMLEAVGYTVVFTETEGGAACEVDGAALTLAEGDVLIEDQDVYVSADFLGGALKSDIMWVADESTLMMDIVEKEAAQAND